MKETDRITRDPRRHLFGYAVNRTKRAAGGIMTTLRGESAIRTGKRTDRQTTTTALAERRSTHALFPVKSP